MKAPTSKEVGAFLFFLPVAENKTTPVIDRAAVNT